HGLDEVHTAIQACRSTGLLSLCYFIIGLPWETRQDILHTIAFARNLGADLVEFHIALPLPGTPLYEMALAQGLLPRSDTPIGADFSIPAMGTRHLSRAEVYALKRQAVTMLYTDPRRLWHLAGRLKNPHRLAWYSLRKLMAIRTRPLPDNDHAYPAA
ncbi:hypothetical protein JW905_03540, partial [bacterium]|nr:hypothetical protein [candidate division CSSED10-310 bacterium]